MKDPIIESRVELKIKFDNTEYCIYRELHEMEEFYADDVDEKIIKAEHTLIKNKFVRDDEGFYNNLLVNSKTSADYTVLDNCVIDGKFVVPMGTMTKNCLISNDINSLENFPTKCLPLIRKDEDKMMFRHNIISLNGELDITLEQWYEYLDECVFPFTLDAIMINNNCTKEEAYNYILPVEEDIEERFKLFIENF